MPRWQYSPYFPVWAFATPLAAAHPASLAEPGFTLRGEPVQPENEPLALFLFRPHPCTLDRGYPWHLTVLKNVSLAFYALVEM